MVKYRREQFNEPEVKVVFQLRKVGKMLKLKRGKGKRPRDLMMIYVLGPTCHNSKQKPTNHKMNNRPSTLIWGSLTPGNPLPCTAIC